MKTYYTVKSLESFQDYIYSSLNNFSQTHENSGRLLAPPVSILDVGLETVKGVLYVIESIALMAINFFGAPFDKDCTLKDSLYSAEWAVIGAMAIPIRVVTAVPKIIFQLLAILLDPKKVQSIAPHHRVYKAI